MRSDHTLVRLLAAALAVADARHGDSPRAGRWGRVVGDRRLSPKARRTLAAFLARATFGLEGAPVAADCGALGAVEDQLVQAPLVVGLGVGALLRFLEWSPPWVLGRRSRFSALSSAAQDEVLGALLDSSSYPVRAAIRALVCLCFRAYYSRPPVRRHLGFDPGGRVAWARAVDYPPDLRASGEAP